MLRSIFQMTATADTTAKSRSTSDFVMLPGLAMAESTMQRLMIYLGDVGGNQ